MITKAKLEGAVLAAVLLVLGGCGQAPQQGTSGGVLREAKAAEPPGKAADDKAAEAKDGGDAKGDADDEKKGGEGKEGVTLTPEQIEKLGLTIQPAQATDYRAESFGYGVVLDHQAIAQGVADAQSAAAAARFSRASFERAQQLHSTPGAMSADVEQTAEQKAAVDSAALMLTTEKLSSTWGMQPPWKENFRDARVQSLARGTTQLVRVTFPLGAVSGTPSELHGGRVGTDRPEATASLHPVWVAPGDANIPGRSFFAMLPAGTVSEGERLQVWAPTGPPVAGALIPISAIVMYGGKFWCYVEKTPGTLARTEVDTSRPTSGGYVVSEGIKPADKIAISAVSQLLAKETGSSEEPD